MKFPNTAVHVRVPRAAALVSGFTLLLTSCATAPGRTVVVPMRDQTVEQQDRDRWECGLWAQNQTDFDPGASLRTGAILGGLAGAALGSGLGAAVGAINGAAGSGAALGAAGGGMVGGPLGGYLKGHADRSAAERAFRACLAARGYTVQ